jgi:hypothetical protein
LKNIDSRESLINPTQVKPPDKSKLHHKKTDTADPVLIAEANPNEDLIPLQRHRPAIKDIPSSGVASEEPGAYSGGKNN